VVSAEVLAGVTKAGFTQTMLGSDSSSQTGTQLYMAPELLAGKPASTRWDIYSLGVVLYQLVLGDLTRPLTTDWSAGINDPLLCDDLRHCFAGNPNERFPGAGQLAKNLRALPDRRRALTEQEAAMAAQARAAYRRGVMRTASAAAVIVIAMAALALWAMASQRKARQIAETRRQGLYVAQVSLAQQAWEEGNLEGAQTLLAAQKPAPKQTDLRAFEWRYLWRLCRDESRLTLATFTNGTGSLAFSPDGQTLAVASGNSVRLWDYAGRRELASLEAHKNGIWSLAFSPTNPRMLASAAADGTIKLWDLATSAVLATLATEDPWGWAKMDAPAFSPDGSTLAWACSDGTVKLRDIETKSLARWLRPGHGERGDPAQCVVFSPDGKILASGGGDTRVRLWNPATGQPIGPPLDGHTAYVLGMAFSRDGRRLATVGFDARVLLWDVATRQAGPPLLGHRGGVRSVAFSPDEETVVTGGFDHTIRFWSVAASRPIGILRGHRSAVVSLAFSRDGQSLVSASEDRRVKVWDAVPPFERDALTNHAGWVSGVALSPDGSILASSDYHTFTVKLWDVSSRRLLTSFPGPAGNQCHLAFSPDGQFLASGGLDQTVRWWNLTAHEMTATNRCEFGIRALVFSPDGASLAAAGDGLRLWQVSSRQEIALIKGDTRKISHVAFSARGPWLATSYPSGKVSVWDAADGTERTSFQD
jgi:WD40 repeat protein